MKLPEFGKRHVQKRRARILIVEDDPDVRRMLRRVFESDYEVGEAEDGLAAWDIFPSYRPGLLVTDIQMPRLDGLSLCRRLRARGFRQLRIIVYTSLSIGVAEARSAGADELVLKSEPLARLREVVIKLQERTTWMPAREGR